MISLDEKNIRRFFIIGLFMKGFDSVLEIFGGILFSFSGGLTSILSFLIKGELIEDPNDFVATHIRDALPYLSTHIQTFGAVYLLSHGLIKLFLVTSLLRGKLWAYPTAIVVLFLFIAYQLYRYSYNHSVLLLFLTFFDLLVVILTWHEYRIVKHRLK